MDIFLSGFHFLLILAGFGLLVFIHELGHFLAAKWAGIRTHAFAVGFGPPIFSWRQGVGLCRGSTERVIRQRLGRNAMEMTDRELSEAGIGETEYSIRWLPLGGFVRMLGQDDLAPLEQVHLQRSFSSVSIGKRMIVISAGVIMNVLLAIVCFIISFAMGVPFEAAVIGGVQPGSPASRATPIAHGVPIGLEPGDRILSIDGAPSETLVDLRVAAGMSIPGEILRIEVLRHGHASPLQFDVTPEEDQLSGMRSIGVMPSASLTLASGRDADPIIQAAVTQAGLASTGIGPGWTLTHVQDQALHTWGDLDRVTQSSSGSPMQSQWSNGEAQIAAVLDPSPQWSMLRVPGAPSFELGILGFVPLVQIDRLVDGSVNEGILQSGDVVLAAGGVAAPSSQEFLNVISSSAGSTLPMRILRDGEALQIDARVARSGLIEQKPRLQVYTGLAWDCPRMASPLLATGMPDGTREPTAAADIIDGVLPGSSWHSVAGRPVSNWEQVWRVFRDAAESGKEVVDLALVNPTPGREIREVQIRLTSASISDLLQLQWQPPLAGAYFEPIQILRQSSDPIKALSMGAVETWKFIELTYLTIDRLIRGSVGIDQLHGPVGIVHLGTKVADRGVAYLLFFLAIISINLAVLNFLPLPIVDGGMFLYLVYEKITGKPPPIAFQNAAMLFGLLLIATAFVVTFYNDLARLLG